MDTLLKDMRFAVRQLLRGKTGTITAIVTLALGISANTSMFTLVNATLFKPVAAADPSKLVWISGGDVRRAVSPLSYPEYLALRHSRRSLSGVLAFEGTDISLGGSTPQRLRAMLVSGNYFDVLGIHASVGRTFVSNEDETPGAHPVVVLSHALWQRRFNGVASITDSTIIVNGAQFSVIGVAPPEFGGLDFDEPSELFVPLAMIAQIMPSRVKFLTEARASWLRVVGRIAPNATREQAQAEVSALAQYFNTPDTRPENRRVYSLTQMAGGLDPSNRREIAPVMALLSVVPLLVLLVACANAANMQLAQGMARRREFAVRRALGASRSRVIRQLLTESVLMSMCAGALGVVLSFWLTTGILRLSNAPVFLNALLSPDLRVLVATTALAMTTGIVFGLVPALSATNPALSPALKDDGATMVIGRQRHRMRSVLVTGQVAVSLILVVTAGLFVRSLTKALSVNPGFDLQHTATASFDLGMQGYSQEARVAFQSLLLERVRAIPGMQSAALAGLLPLSGRMWGTGVLTESETSDDQQRSVGFNSITPEYLTTMGIPVVRGRDFTARDNASSGLVVIVDETLAKRLWPNGNAIGQRLRVESHAAPLREVVGVARNGYYDSLIEQPRGFFYLPYAQYGSFESSLSLVVSTANAPTTVLAPLSAVFKQLDPNMPLYRLQTLKQNISQVTDKQRAAAALLGLFGVMALLLASLGMYGVTAHGVRLRTREIGIRMSLGAQSTDVLALFVRESVRLSLIGVVIGLVASAGISRVIAGFLFGLAPTDALTFVTGGAVLCVVAAIASYLPARRAAGADPLVALRAD